MTVAPISLHVAEDQLEQHLRSWIVDLLGAAVASDPNLSRVDAAQLAPLAWGRADDWDPNLNYESNVLPLVVITCGGKPTAPLWSDGLRFDEAQIGLMVVTENQRAGDQVIGCNLLTRLYDFALTNLFAADARRRISDSFVIEEAVSTRLSAMQDRGLAFCAVELAASVCTATSDPEWLDNPTYGELPRDPDEVVQVESTEVLIERTPA